MGATSQKLSREEAAEGQGDEGGIPGEGRTLWNFWVMEDGGGPAFCSPPAAGAD